ncbi:hypothetical protein EV363DRAFT_929744 [Boletus edulis]|nr:hypothetical protein EV363DRAFT_929744 [Boletus edulis]
MVRFWGGDLRCCVFSVVVPVSGALLLLVFVSWSFDGWCVDHGALSVYRMLTLILFGLPIRLSSVFASVMGWVYVGGFRAVTWVTSGVVLLVLVLRRRLWGYDWWSSWVCGLSSNLAFVWY